LRARCGRQRFRHRSGNERRNCRQRALRIYEIGISYYGRSYAEGKKINWKDGLKALWYVFKFR